MYGFVYFLIKIITRKPLEVRMGKGKGNPEFWAAVVEPGRIIFECDGVTQQVAQEAMELGCSETANQNQIYCKKRLTGIILSRPMRDKFSN